MKKLLSLAAVAGIVAAFAAPAQADEFVARYTYLVNGVQVPTAAATTVLTQPAVIQNSCAAPTVLTQPAVIDSTITAPAVVSKPIMVEHHENLVPHIFHLGLWPLVDFSIF
jgi:hypothetical protein